MNRVLVSLKLDEAYLLNPEGQTVAEVYKDPASLINILLPNIFTFAGLLLFLFIVGAGLKIVMNPDNKKSTEEGKKALTYAVGGFLLLFAVYWIVQILEYVTGVVILGGT